MGKPTVLWIVGSVAVFLIMLGVVSYNGLVSQDEGVSGAWSEVQVQIKRRVDLIPNLVNTVKGYAEHERGVFNEVTEARAKISQAVKIDASALANNPLLQKQLLEAQQSLNASLGRLIAVAENYPLLKASENFRALQDEFAGTENRVAVARGRAVRATKDYNQSTRTIPTSFVASMFGFKHKDYYEAPESAQNAPIVNFGK